MVLVAPLSIVHYPVPSGRTLPPIPYGTVGVMRNAQEPIFRAVMELIRPGDGVEPLRVQAYALSIGNRP